MSYTAYKDQIQLTIGDSLYLQLEITDAAGAPFEPAEGDVIRFAMKKNYSDEECLIRKTIPNDTLLLTFAPEDTKQLAAGPYVYDIQITVAETGDVDTFISGTLELTPEVE